MHARYVASEFIKHVFIGSKKISVELVTRTDVWYRLKGYPRKQALESYADDVGNGLHSIHPQTTRVAIKELDHESPKDPRNHYTVYELNDSDDVLASRHVLKSKN